MLLPGVTLNTAADDGFPIESMQLMRFKGERWELFGEVDRHPQGVRPADRLTGNRQVLIDRSPGKSPTPLRRGVGTYPPDASGVRPAWTR